MPLTVEQFCQRAIRAGLLSEIELRKFLVELPPDRRPTRGKDLALALHQSKRLTKYQAETLYRDDGRPLVLGNYVILKRIGSGGMGEVYKAEHRDMGRIVAVKILKEALTENARAVGRFQREVRTVARLAHRNIVAAYDASRVGDVRFLVMEYVPGENLSRLVRQRGPLPVDLAVDCIAQAADGLGYAHGQGIIHRDVKPGNLLLSDDGTLKVLDLGLAGFGATPDGADGAASDADDEQLTNAHSLVGTADFLAPERATDPKSVDHRSDIYSLGCTLFYLLTGQVPYPADYVMQKVLAHRDEPIPSLTAFRPDVPAALDGIFRGMVAKRPEDRYQSMADVAAVLRSLGDQGQSAAAPAGARWASGPGDTDAEMEQLLATFDVDEPMPPGGVGGPAESVAGFDGVPSGVPGTPSRTGRGRARQARAVRQSGAFWGTVVGCALSLVTMLYLVQWVRSREAARPANPTVIAEQQAASPRPSRTVPASAPPAAHVAPTEPQPAEVPGDPIPAANPGGLQSSDGAADSSLDSPLPGIDQPPAGFVTLFNGKDLTGWKGLVGNPKTRAQMSPEALKEAEAKATEDAKKHWQVKDGIIVFDGQGQNLVTAKDYGNFVLLVDWKIEPKGDSGIYLRGTPQVQIWDPGDGGRNAVGSGGLFNNQKNPSQPLTVADNPVGQWNTFRIRMVGEKVTVYLNDKLVVDNVTMENYWERSKPIYETGPIELQSHSNKLHVRNIFLQELDEDGDPQLQAFASSLPGGVGDVPQPPETSPATPPSKLDWQAPAGPPEELFTLPGHEDVITSVAFAPDGRHVLSGSVDGTARCWDLAEKREVFDVRLGSYKGKPEPVFDVVISPDGRLAALASPLQIVVIGMDDGGKKHTLTPPRTGQVFRIGQVAFSPDGRRILSEIQTAMLIWDSETGRRLDEVPIQRAEVIQPHEQQAADLAFIGGDEVLIEQPGAAPKFVRLNIATGRQEQTTLSSGPTYDYHADRGLVLKGWKNYLSTSQLNGNLAFFYAEPSAAVTSVRFLPDGHRFVAGSLDKTLAVHRTGQRDPLHVFRPTTACTNRIAVSPDGRAAVSGGGATNWNQKNWVKDGDFALHVWRLPDL